MIRHPDGSVTVTYKLEITRGRKGHRRVAERTPLPERPAINQATVPRITRLLVLGYHFEQMVLEGKVKNYAEIARLTGLSKSRVTQICNLTLLAPNLQESILLDQRGNIRATVLEGRLRPGTEHPSWDQQRHVFAGTTHN
jgi:hypothetical protein